ncbi:MAG TPA: hypothetical protein VJR29_13505, partial [bacterium]|nr:hypothetical protein [bacterium]
GVEVGQGDPGGRQQQDQKDAETLAHKAIMEILGEGGNENVILRSEATKDLRLPKVDHPAWVVVDPLCP